MTKSANGGGLRPDSAIASETSGILARMRRFIGPLFLVLALILPALAFADRGPQNPRLQPRAVDVKLAQGLLAVNADLPAGFRDMGLAGGANITSGAPACMPSLHSLVATADVGGHTFARSNDEDSVSSAATFFLTTQEAGTAMARYSSAKTGRCLRTTLLGDLQKSIGSKATFQVRALPLTLANGDLKVTVWNVLIAIKIKGRTIGGEFLVTFYHRGRVISNLDISTYGGLNNADVGEMSKAMITRLKQLPATAIS